MNEGNVEPLVSDVDEDEKLTFENEEPLPTNDEGVPNAFFEDDKTPEAPDDANIDNAVSFKRLDEEGENTGASEDAMFIGRDEEGKRMFITQSKGAVGDTMGAVSDTNIVNDELDEDVNMPDAFVDEERRSTVLADASDNETKPVGLADRFSGETDFDRELTRCLLVRTKTIVTRKAVRKTS